MNESQLIKLLAQAKTQEDYDKLIDKHIFHINKKNRNYKKNRKYNMLTAEQMKLIYRKEKSTDPDFL